MRSHVESKLLQYTDFVVSLVLLYDTHYFERLGNFADVIHVLC